MKIKPLERNKYYYGKLLTVLDFEAEQRYVVKKQDIMNRIVLGGGVLSGLQVIKVSDKEISIESGAALDYMGRLVIVSEPIIKKLSDVEGFPIVGETNEALYLCLAYEEKNKDIVRTVNSHVERGDELSAYNRTQESYRLVIYTEHTIGKTKAADDGKSTSVKQHFQGQSFEDCVYTGPNNCICLARIPIKRIESTSKTIHEFKVEGIEPLPFGEYIYTNAFIKAYLSQVNEEKPKESMKALTVETMVKSVDATETFQAGAHYDKKSGKLTLAYQVPKTHQMKMLNTGTVSFETKGKLFSEAYLSDEIDHGLGKGNVMISVSFLESETQTEDALFKREGDAVYSGDIEVFLKTQDEPKIQSFSYGTVVFPEQGTFKIGARISGAKKHEKVILRWWAYKAEV